MSQLDICVSERVQSQNGLHYCVLCVFLRSSDTNTHTPAHRARIVRTSCAGLSTKLLQSDVVVKSVTVEWLRVHPFCVAGIPV